MSQSCRGVVFVAGLFIAFPVSTFAQFGLQKLPFVGVDVIVNGVDEPGRHEVQEQTVTELQSQFRIHGISVQEGQDPKAPRGIWLQVEISIAPEPKDWAAMSVRASLRQTCRLSRPPNTELVASTWEMDFIEIVRKSDWRERLRDILHDVSDTFVSAYWRENPGRTSERSRSTERVNKVRPRGPHLLTLGLL